MKAEYDAGKLIKRQFSSLAEYQAATAQDRHSILLGEDVFVRARLPDPADPQRLYRPADFDFRLRPGSAALDRGTLLPSITDSFTGAAPDLGAYELGSTPPDYGPRAWPTGSSPTAP